MHMRWRVSQIFWNLCCNNIIIIISNICFRLSIMGWILVRATDINKTLFLDRYWFTNNLVFSIQNSFSSTIINYCGDGSYFKVWISSKILRSFDETNTIVSITSTRICFIFRSHFRLFSLFFTSSFLKRINYIWLTKWRSLLILFKNSLTQLYQFQEIQA